MRDEEIEKIVEKLVKAFSEIETDLLTMIAEHYKINDSFINSDHWRFEKLKEMDLFSKEIIDYLAKETGVSKEKIMEALHQINVKTIDMPTLRGAFDNGFLTVDPDVLINNPVIEDMIRLSYDELEDTFTHLKSNMEASCRKAYLDVMDKAYYKMVIGSESYETAIKQSLNELGNKGITALTYTQYDEAGNVVGIRNLDIVAAARREVLNGLRNLSNKIAMETVDELQPEYVIISEHRDCRPQHFDWQGTVIKREDLVEVTDYGSETGLGGINCRHYFNPYFGDPNDVHKRVSKEDAEHQYKLKQKQRAMERTIRKWRQKEKIFKANGDKEAVNVCRKKITNWINRIDRFCDDNNIARDYARERI